MGDDGIVSFPRALRTTLLTDEEVERIHARSLDVLQRAGVSTTNEHLLDVMTEHGQAVDRDAGRIRFDPAFVEERVALADGAFTFAARDPARDLPIDGARGYLSTDGCPADVWDLDAQARRPGTKADLMDMTRLADALPQIGFLWQPCSANDTPVPVRPLHETHAQLLSTTKHIQQMTAVDGANARAILELATVVAGGAEALRARPILSNFQCIISPLHWDAGPVDAMEVFASAGIPMGICSMPLAGASGPVTIAGTVALTNAEILSGITILQTLVPGARTFRLDYPVTIDLQTGAMNPVWGPEETYAQMAATQVARRYGLPSAATCMAIGGKAPDWQAGVQSMLMTFANMMMPADMLNGAGGLNGCTIFSPVELLLDCEIFDIAARWADGYAFDDEHLAIDTIVEVGPAGHFLDSGHTLEHMREIWRTSFMDRRTWDSWLEDGKPDPLPAAEAQARRLLAEHEPAPLPDDIETELGRIVAAYETAALARPG